MRGPEICLHPTKQLPLLGPAAWTWWNGLPWKGGSIQLQGGSSEGLAWTGRCPPHVAHPHDWKWCWLLAGSPSFSLPGPPHSLLKGPPYMVSSFPRIWDQGRSHNAFSMTLSQKPHTLTFILFCWLQNLPWFNVGGDNAKAWISWRVTHWGPFGMLAATNDPLWTLLTLRLYDWREFGSY